MLRKPIKDKSQFKTIRIKGNKENPLGAEKIKVAVVIEGEGIGLSLYDPATGNHDDLPWPDDWPELVSLNFIASQGYKIKYA